MAVDTAIMNELYTKLGVSSTEAEPTAMPEDPSMAAQAYKQYEELPLMQQLGLAVAPGTGHAIAAYETPMFAGETKEAIEEGNIPRALGQGALTGLSALGMIPGLGLGIRGVKAGIKAATKAIPKIDFPNLKNKFLFDELQDNDYITLYHGTNKANLERVAKEGIKADKEGFSYLTPDPDTGLGYASMAKGEKSIIRSRKRIDPAHAPIEDRVLLEVKVPRKILEENLPNQRQWAFNEKRLLSPEARQRFYDNVDETGMSIGESRYLEPYYQRTELRFQGDIPPELISGYTTKGYKGSSKFAPEDIPTRWYRGTTNIGESSSPAKWKTGKEGVLGGGGIYVTPDPKYASRLATENVLGKPITGGFVTPLDVTFKNPLVVSVSKTGQPEIKILENLGISAKKAEDMVEKAYEIKGGFTTEIKNRAIKQGYDGIILKRDGIIQEAISYKPEKNIISAITKKKQGGSIVERNPNTYNMRAI